MSRRSRVDYAVVALFAVGMAAEARAQGWSVDVSGGRIVYDAVSTDIGTSNLIGTIRYDAARQAWIYGSAAAPLRTPDPLWGAFGGGGRFMAAGSAARRATVGIDLAADGFVFRDRVVQQSGSGGSVDVLPFVRVNAGSAFVEARGGWRGYRLSYLGTSDNRGVIETGARVGYGATLQVRGDVRFVHAREGTYPLVGGSLVYGSSPVQLWAQAGRWLSDSLVDDVVLGGGIGVALGSRATLWASVQQEASDPLYWNAARRTWSVGVTRRFGRPSLPVLASPPSQAGAVVIRLSVRDSSEEPISIAGDFNNWQPVPMQREGSEWIIRLPLSAGIYHYAFRSSTGEWFVPGSVAGRRDDGFGGHVAVLVVI